MGFNARYLLDALAVTTDEHVALDLNDPLTRGLYGHSVMNSIFM